jgi:hypothetical protein
MIWILSTDVLYISFSNFPLRYIASLKINSNTTYTFEDVAHKQQTG